MKKYIFLIIPIILVVGVFSCEKDDICAESTPTTPQLIIRFYDNASQTDTKTVNNIRIQGVGNENVLSDFNIVDTDSIILPLRTNTTSTQFMLNENYVDETNTGNEDIITINYTTENVYVSRACGFKTIFKNVTVEIVSDSDNWILFGQTTEDNLTIENETAAHYNFFH